MKNTILIVSILVISFSSISYGKVNENFRIPYVRECVAAATNDIKGTNFKISAYKIQNYCSCTFDEISKDNDDASYLKFNELAINDPEKATEIMAKYVGICANRLH